MSCEIASSERGDAAAEKAKKSKRLNKARRMQFQLGTSCGVSLLAFHAGVTGHHALHEGNAFGFSGNVAYLSGARWMRW